MNELGPERTSNWRVSGSLGQVAAEPRARPHGSRSSAAAAPLVAARGPGRHHRDVRNEPYRSPCDPAPGPPRSLGDDGLDEGALARLRAAKQRLEELDRREAARGTARLRARLVAAIGVVLTALGSLSFGRGWDAPGLELGFVAGTGFVGAATFQLMGVGAHGNDAALENRRGAALGAMAGVCAGALLLALR